MNWKSDSIGKSSSERTNERTNEQASEWASECVATYKIFKRTNTHTRAFEYSQNMLSLSAS